MNRDDASPSRAQRLLTASWPILHPFGVEIRVNWLVVLFPAVAAVLMAIFVRTRTPGGLEPDLEAIALWAVPFTVAHYLATGTHELAHVLMARRFGVPARVVTLTPLSALVHPESAMPTPRAEILTALVGPAAQAAWVLALAVPYLRFDIGAEADAGTSWMRWAEAYRVFAVCQVAVVAFNLFPCWPLDNGRVLRGFLGRWLPSRKAALNTAQLGFALAIVLFLVGLGLAFYGLGHALPSAVILGLLSALIGIHNFLRCRALPTESPRVESFEPVESWKSGHAGEAWKDSIAESERLSRAEDRRERREAEARRREEDERRKLKDRIDQLLDRINEVGGVEKLPPAERRELAEASERLRTEAAAVR